MVLIVAASDEREPAFTLGVRPVKGVAWLSPGSEACQSPLFVQQRFRGVAFDVRSRGPGAAVEVIVKRRQEVLASGRLERGYAAPSTQRVRLDRTVPADLDVAVCLRNRATASLALTGDISAGLGQGELRVDGRKRDDDLRLVFLRERPRSALSLVPEMLRRAALFKQAWVGPWTFWTLLALVVLGAPLLLAGALSAAATDQAGSGSRSRKADRSASST